MKRFLPQKQSCAILAVFMLMVTGTYNALVINSDSSITSQEARFVKRLDEVYGVVIPGRVIATTTKWKKIPARTTKSKTKNVALLVKKNVALEASAEVPASVQEELDLTLAEVINPKKWKKGLTPGQFAGQLVTNNGTIEYLSVSLPNDESISISFSEMTGNVFEYDQNGEVYSGMLYQVDQSSYMVTLSNGPLEGTRMRFSQNLPQNNEIESAELQTVSFNF